MPSKASKKGAWGELRKLFFLNVNPKARICFEQTGVNTGGKNKARYSEDRLGPMYQIRNVKKKFN